MSRLVNLAYRVLYICAYRMMRVYWMVRHPKTHGALVAVWHEGKLLMTRNSYVRYYSVPGGYVHLNETGRQAARRELAEEVGMAVSEQALRSVVDRNHIWEGKRERIEIFETDADDPPAFEPDGREVIVAEFVTPAEALSKPMFPPLREYLEARAAAGQIDAPQRAAV